MGPSLVATTLALTAPLTHIFVTLRNRAAYVASWFFASKPIETAICK